MIDVPSDIFHKFDLICYVLPYFGRFHYCEYLMKRLSSKSSELWKYYKESFKQIDNRRPFEAVFYELDVFDQDYYEFLKSFDVSMNYKIRVKIKGGITAKNDEIEAVDSMKNFIEYLKYCESNDIMVMFDEISGDFDMCNPNLVFTAYKMLYKQGLGQEQLILKH